MIMFERKPELIIVQQPGKNEIKKVLNREATNNIQSNLLSKKLLPTEK